MLSYIRRYCDEYKQNIDLVDKIERECFKIEDLQKKLVQRYIALQYKTETIEQYGWACPTTDLIRCISNFNNGNTIVSIGSGVGFIEHLLEKNNCRVIASDLYTDHEMISKNNFFKKPVLMDGVEMSKQTKQDDTLLLCWSRKFAGDVLKNFKGKRVIYIGEGCGGCCAGDDFFIELKNWVEIKYMSLPAWFHTYNYASFYIRKKIIDPSLKGKKLKNRKRYIRRCIKFEKDLLVENKNLP
jgi:hypothetical protein